MAEGAGGDAILTERTFKEMFDEGILPSGNTFELMEDTVDTAIRVAEVNDAKTWKRKALEAFTITKRVGVHEVHEVGPEFIHGMLDTDVTFLSLAWAAQLNGSTLDLDGESVPCPSCARPFKQVDFGDLKCRALPAPLVGPQATYEVKGIEDSELPSSLKGCTMYVSHPTWMGSKSSMPESSWDKEAAVNLYRALSSIRASSTGGGTPRVPSIKGEARLIKASAVPKIIKTMDSCIPNFRMHLDMVCPHCREVAVIPFSQGL
jgi:hypothetical protein